MENLKTKVETVLAWSEIFKFLTKDQLQLIASESLRNQLAEEALEKFKTTEGRLSILTAQIVERPFTNLNWQYYLGQFEKLQPKKLILSSLFLNDLTGLKSLQKLESFKLSGIAEVNLPHLALNESKLSSLLEELLELPRLEQVEINCFLPAYLRHNEESANEDNFLKLKDMIKRRFVCVKQNLWKFSFSDRKHNSF